MYNEPWKYTQTKSLLLSDLISIKYRVYPK